MQIIKNKINRLFQSKNVLKLKFYIHKYFKEKDIGNLGLNFENKPDRSIIIQKIIDYKNYINYLEIGCFSNELFNKLKIENKVGVDPVSGGTIKATSDEFFKNNKKNFDIIFIDGLHHYHQVKKDINNSINFLSENGVILLHDCLPNNVYDQAIPRCTFKWNGDVWKAIVEARSSTTSSNLSAGTNWLISPIDNASSPEYRRPVKSISFVLAGPTISIIFFILRNA